MNSQSNKNSLSAAAEAEHPTSSGQVSLNLGYSHSEFSLCAPLVGPIISQQCLPEPTDGDLSDDDLPDEVVLSHTRLSYRAEPQKPQKPRLYVDLDLAAGPSGSARARAAPSAGASAKGANVALRGGEEDQAQSAEQRLSRAADLEQKNCQQRLAFGCPLSSCETLLNSANCLAHCLAEHPLVATLPMRPNATATLRLGLPLVLTACGSQQCIGVLAFASGQQSGSNLHLPANRASYRQRLAVMVLLWKTSWDARRNGPMVAHLYNLWLFCPQAHPALQVLVSAESQISNEPGGAKQQVKQQLVPTSPSLMLLSPREMQRETEFYMRFTHRDMKLLTNNFKTDIDLKLTIHEEQSGSDRPQRPQLNQLNLQSLVQKQIRERQEQAFNLTRTSISKLIIPKPRDFVEGSFTSIRESIRKSIRARELREGSCQGSCQGSCRSLDSMTDQLPATKNQTAANSEHNCGSQSENAPAAECGQVVESAASVCEQVQVQAPSTCHEEQSLPALEVQSLPAREVQSLPALEEQFLPALEEAAQSLPEPQNEQSPEAYEQLQPVDVFEEAKSRPSEEEEDYLDVFEEALSRPSEERLSPSSEEPHFQPVFVDLPPDEPSDEPAKQNKAQAQPEKETLSQPADESCQCQCQPANGHAQQVDSASQSEEQQKQKQTFADQEPQEEQDENEDLLLLVEEFEAEDELELEEEESQHEQDP